MYYVDRLNKIFGQTDQDDCESLVLVAATLATRLNLDESTVDNICTTVINEDDEKTVVGQPPIVQPAELQSILSPGRQQIKDLRDKLSNLIDKDNDVRRVDREKEVQNIESITDRDSALYKSITYFGRRIVQNIKKLPHAERAQALRQIIIKILDRANVFIQQRYSDEPGAQQYGDMSRRKLSMRPVFAPVAIGRQPLKEEFDNHDYAILDVLYQSTRDIAIIMESTDDNIGGIIKSLKNSKIDPQSAAIVLKQVIKGLMSATGLKPVWNKSEWRSKNMPQMIRGYVDDAIERQKGMTDKTIVLSYAKMTQPEAQQILNIYAKAIRDAGCGNSLRMQQDKRTKRISLIFSDNQKPNPPIGNDPSDVPTVANVNKLKKTALPSDVLQNVITPEPKPSIVKEPQASTTKKPEPKLDTVKNPEQKSDFKPVESDPQAENDSDKPTSNDIYPIPPDAIIGWPPDNRYATKLPPDGTRIIGWLRDEENDGKFMGWAATNNSGDVLHVLSDSDPTIKSNWSNIEDDEFIQAMLSGKTFDDWTLIRIPADEEVLIKQYEDDLPDKLTFNQKKTGKSRPKKKKRKQNKDY